MINDKELLAMIRDSKTQREGFAVLVSQYSEPLYWKVRHIVLDHDDADDVLQNAFVKIREERSSSLLRTFAPRSR